MPNISIIEVNDPVYDLANYNVETSYKKMFGLLFNTLFPLSFCMLKCRELTGEVASYVMLVNGEW